LKAHFGARLRPLSEADARLLAGNSFHVRTESGPVAFVPEGTSDALTGALREGGARVEKVDVSEFADKGGGGPKSLVLNLGAIIDDPNRPAPADDMALFREQRRYKTLVKAGRLP
jgi:hypothetical protein